MPWLTGARVCLNLALPGSTGVSQQKCWFRPDSACKTSPAKAALIDTPEYQSAGRSEFCRRPSNQQALAALHVVHSVQQGTATCCDCGWAKDSQAGV